MSSLVEVFPKSVEYERVKYRLQLGLGSVNVAGLKVWMVENPHLNVQFERNAKELLKLESWVSVKNLIGANRPENVFKYGFTFPPGEGMTFEVGKVNVDATSSARDRKQPAISAPHRFVMCNVAVGRTFASNECLSKLPGGYNSLFLINSDSSEYQQNTTHEYVVPDTSQILPMFLVEFQIITLKQLVMMGDVDADANPLEAAAEANSAMNSANLSDRCEKYDPILKQPVSARDLLTGSHSSGPAASHKLIDIRDAHRAAVSASHKDDVQTSVQLAELDQKLLGIQQELGRVDQSAVAVEEELYAATEEALYQLQDHTQAKVALVLAEELELRRQLEEIEWVEGLVDAHKALPAVELVTAWKNLSLLDREHLDRREGARERQLRLLSAMDSQGSLALSGNLEVSMQNSGGAR